MDNALKDLTGQEFGFWRVTAQAPRAGRNHTRWHCECVTCGFKSIRRGNHLKHGKFAKCFGKHDKVGRGGGRANIQPPGHANATETFNLYRLRAVRAGRVFNLTRDEFQAITQQDCHYCGCAPAQVANRKHFNGPFIYNGIDRKDSALGYEAGNCLPCCGSCNSMKSDIPYDEFLKRVAAIYQRRIG